MSQTQESREFLSPCSKCNKETFHRTLTKHEESGDAEYHYEAQWAILRCCGCGGKSFRYVHEDFENAYRVDENEWEIPTEIKIYPKVIKDHTPISGIWHVPSIVRDIYEETLISIQEDSPTLAGLGLRSTIEAICKDRAVSGKDLLIKINKLCSTGLISKRDAERLHGIRFLGNDATHELKAPKPEQISVALKIVEHLIQSVYILENEAKGFLEIGISEYQDFLSIVDENVKKMKKGSEEPISVILGKEYRRVHSEKEKLEDMLKDDINSGKYSKLTLGKVAPVPGAPSPKPRQYFIVS